jgi:hypothetical protein
MSALEPGTLNPVTDAVVPAGATTAASALPVMAEPGGVVTAMGGATKGVAAQQSTHSASDAWLMVKCGPLQLGRSRHDYK